jgi:Protein kinase domain
MARGTLYGGRWKTGGGLGQGGQGHVFRATDTSGQLEGEFALKRILNPERRERFHNEIEATKHLSHPNIIKLIDHSALDSAGAGDEQRSFLVMPIAEGGDLSDRSRLGIYTGSTEAVLKVAQQAASALEVAHAAGVIHRDVKPQNILFTGKGHDIWISDFGICLIRGRERPTETGEVVGPHGFMAPELEHGGKLEVTAAADVYSLGKVIFYMFSDGIVVPRETVDDERYDQLFEVSDRTQRLRFLLGRMISPLPQRLKSMADVLRELQALQDWERNAHVPLISEAGLAGIQELRRRSHKVRQINQNNDTVRESEKRALDAVKESFLAWLEPELTIAAASFGNDDNIEAKAGKIGEAGRGFEDLVWTGSNTAYVPITALELRLQLAENNFRQLHRLRVQLVAGPKEITTARAGVLGTPEPEPVPQTVQDHRLAMIPRYFQSVLGEGTLITGGRPARQGFFTRRSMRGGLRGHVALPPRDGAPTLRGFRAARVTTGFHPEFIQCTPFRLSEWLTVRETLRSALKEAIDIFIDFVVSGATDIGP